MPRTHRAPASPLTVLAALILGVCVIQVANGILQILLPLRLAEAAAPPLVVGAVASAYSVGFVLGCWAAPWMIRRVGGVWSFAAFGLLAAAATLLLNLLPDARAWVGLRMLMGVSYVGMLTVAESGLAGLSPPGSRGSVFSLYMIACKVAVIGGQMLLASPDLSALWLTVLAAGCYGLSLVPVAVIRPPASAAPKGPTPSPWQYVRRAPVAFAGCLMVGLCNTAVTGIGPAWLAGLALPAAGIALIMSGIQVGSVVLQWPIGRFSDRHDRRLVIFAVSAVATVAAFLIAAFANPPGGAAPQTVLLGLFTLWGSAALSLYAICVAHANDHVTVEETVPLASALLLAWALGAALGPLLATAAMEWFGHDALFVYVGVVSGGLTLFAGLRRLISGPFRAEP